MSGGEREKALDSVHRLLSGRVGLRLDPSLRSRLDRCLTEAARDHGEADAGVYAERLEHDPALFQDLLNRITVQETSFFRDPAQFDALAIGVLPELPDPVAVWSAGCATGQEAYSLAIVLAEAGRTTASVIATDVSTQALRHAERGIYRERDVAGMGGRRERWFSRLPAGSDGAPRWQVVPELRQMVSFRHHNLALEDPPMLPLLCSVIFCRNVLIYFNRDDTLAALARFRRWLAPGGHLFLGYSESLWQVTDTFLLERVGLAFAYRPHDPSRPAPVPGVAHRAAAMTAASAAAPAPRPRPPAPAAPPPPVPAASGLPAVSELLADGEAALAAGDAKRAAAQFRKAAAIDPDHPLAHFQLGICLEAIGDPGARRAFAAARAAIDRCDGATVQSALEGYGLDDLMSVLDFKLARSQ